MPSSFSLPSSRVLNLAAAALSAALLAYAYFVQFGLGVEPCPLCIMQRLALIAVMLVFLGAGIHDPQSRGRLVWATLVALAAGTGMALAARHVWLQHLPPELVPACGPGLNYLIDVLPLFDALKEAFQGSGECAVINWTLFGLSMPEWTLTWFVSFGAGGVWNNLRSAVARP